MKTKKQIKKEIVVRNMPEVKGRNRKFIRGRASPMAMLSGGC